MIRLSFQVITLTEELWETAKQTELAGLSNRADSDASPNQHYASRDSHELVTPNLYGKLVANTAAGIAGGTGVMPGGVHQNKKGFEPFISIQGMLDKTMQFLSKVLQLAM